MDESIESETDERLMLRCAARDLEALGMLVERHHATALRFAFRLSGDRDMAQDATQEAFLRIFRGARGYDERGLFRSYLFQVVRNSVLGSARTRSRRREDPLDDRLAEERGGPLSSTRRQHHADPDAAHSMSPDRPDRILEGNDLRERLTTALQALPEDLRAVFVLSEIEGCSYREIARICRCPIGTVASRKHAAVEKLRALLRDLRPS